MSRHRPRDKHGRFCRYQEHSYTANEVCNFKNEKDMKTENFVATERGRFNWLGFIVELLKAAIAFVAGSQVI